MLKPLMAAASESEMSSSLSNWPTHDSAHPSNWPDALRSQTAQEVFGRMERPAREPNVALFLWDAISSYNTPKTRL